MAFLSLGNTGAGAAVGGAGGTSSPLIRTPAPADQAATTHTLAAINDTDSVVRIPFLRAVYQVVDGNGVRQTADDVTTTFNDLVIPAKSYLLVGQVNVPAFLGSAGSRPTANQRYWSAQLVIGNAFTSHRTGAQSGERVYFTTI